ncbi:MAG: thiolase family protein [Actinobacteria bacterium]|nr:thiolase family protein [Actinomycetota bacterium]
MTFNPKQCALAGIAETQVGRIPDRDSMQMYAELAVAAAQDAGLRKEEIDGLITGGTFLRNVFMHNAVVSEYLRMRPRYSSGLVMGGGVSWCHALGEACNAINAGVCNTVLVIAADPFFTVCARTAIDLMAEFFDPQYELPFGFVTPAMFAFAARRHMLQYGTSSEQLAQVAVSQRRNASLNPLAQFRKPIAIEDVLSSRMICSPLHLLDCSPISDGGGAFIVTSGDRARSLRKPPVYVLGYGEAHELEYTDPNRDITTSAAVRSGKDAYAAAGVGPEDIDFAEIYDCFTITMLVHLESLGFCPRGEGGAFVEDRRLEVDGDFPTNTHGGLLSHGHPGVPAGIFHIIEAVKQLRREVEPERQVRNTGTCLVHGNSALFRDAATAILSCHHSV